MSTNRGAAAGERAVSPVIGTVMLVAVVAILAAVVAAATLGFGTPAVAPTVAFDVTTENGSVVVTHAQGEAVDAEQLRVRYAGSETTWAALGGSGSVAAGDSVSLPASETGTLQIVWWSPDGAESAILRERFLAPASALDVKQVTAGGTGSTTGFSGFSDQHLRDQGFSPAGHFREVPFKSADRRLQSRITGSDTQVSGSPQSLSRANAGESRRFTLRYDGSEFTYTIDGRTVTTDEFAMDDDALAVMAKIRGSAVDRVRVTDLRLNGQPLGKEIDLSQSGDERSVLVEADGLNEGFELTGTTTYDYTGTSGGEDLSIRIDVA
jgi:flagellin-like protein